MRAWQQDVKGSRRNQSLSNEGELRAQYACVQAYYMSDVWRAS